MTQRLSSVRTATVVVAAVFALFARDVVAAPDVEGSTGKTPQRTDEGWTSQWGMLFSLNNVLVQGQILGGFQNLGTAATYFLAPNLAVRGGLSLSRTSNPVAVTRTEVSTGDDSLVTYQFGNPGTTSSHSGTLSGELLYRLTSGAVAPYVGGGLTFGLGQSRQDYVDDVSVQNQVTTVRNATTSLSIGLRGVAGAEWRLHSHFALFAEYELSVNAFTLNAIANEMVVENSAGGATTVTRTTQERNVPTWFTGGNLLAQGGTLGLIVFF